MFVVIGIPRIVVDVVKVIVYSQSCHFKPVGLSFFCVQKYFEDSGVVVK